MDQVTVKLEEINITLSRTIDDGRENENRYRDRVISSLQEAGAELADGISAGLNTGEGSGPLQLHRVREIVWA
mgnify:FL=1